MLEVSTREKQVVRERNREGGVYWDLRLDKLSKVLIKILSVEEEVESNIQQS